MNSKCFGFGNYKISFVYSKQVEELVTPSNITYSLEVSSIVLLSKLLNQIFNEEEYFTICSTDNNCNNYNGYTINTCNQVTRLCENIDISNNETCVECRWVVLEFVTDNYSIETR